MEWGFLFVDQLGKPAWLWLALPAMAAVVILLEPGARHGQDHALAAKHGAAPWAAIRRLRRWTDDAHGLRADSVVAPVEVR